MHILWFQFAYAFLTVLMCSKIFVGAGVEANGKEAYDTIFKFTT